MSKQKFQTYSNSISKSLVAFGMSLCLALSSCVPTDSARSTRSKTSAGTATPNDGSGIGNGAGPDDGNIGGVPIDGTLTSGRAELRHIVDPFTGTFKTKVTIPKNYKGMLYLSGLNIPSLNDREISVRFRFGREKEEIIIPATIGRAPGITPQTDIQVLILDMEDQPFRNLRLFYDLFDYNEYDTNKDGIEFGAGDDLAQPTDDIRDAGLYCRGLNLEDDPTFSISSTNSACDEAGETCLYAYARIKDAGLNFLNAGEFNAISPTEPQLDIFGSGYGNQSQAEILKKCLPDVDHRNSVETVLQTTTSSSSTTKVAYGDTVFGTAFTYLGPYRTLARDLWQISGEAVFSDLSSPANSPSGLFQAVLNNAPTNTATDPNAKAEAGMKSFLFPRSGKLDLQPGVEYVGFTDISSQLNATRSIRTLVAAGETEFVDGCNIRVTNTYETNNEGISSCNVTGTIDLITTDTTTGELITLNSTNSIKLQLSRASATDFLGNEVRFSALKSCSSSNACGSNECCFNERCWSKDLVSQCLEDVPGEGNLGFGETCNSDFQCTSLCCSGTTGTCAPHNPGEGNFCSKTAGQQCVTKEFCKQENVPECIIVKEGTNAQGQPTCTLRCYNVPTFGECSSDGICLPPATPAVPIFDPANPDCSNAEEPPTSI
jgi:hypothetical protein